MKFFQSKMPLSKIFKTEYKPFAVLNMGDKAVVLLKIFKITAKREVKRSCLYRQLPNRGKLVPNLEVAAYTYSSPTEVLLKIARIGKSTLDLKLRCLMWLH